MNSNIKYFPGIDGLRFVGAFAVILSHIEFLKSIHGFGNLMDFGFYKNTNGHLGVILFFVISGYLITYLLLKEYNKEGRINIWKFYVRRILRIWPLYYLMVLISVFLIPLLFKNYGFVYTQFKVKESFLYFLFLPNVAKSLKYSIDGIVHLWSVGIEEQFYLIWPWIFNFFKKYLKLIFLVIIVAISLLPTFFSFLNYNGYINLDNNVFDVILSNIYQMKINSMAIGGIFSIIYFYKSKLLSLFYRFKLEIILIPFTFFCWVIGYTFGKFSDEIYSLLFASIILISSTKEDGLFKFEYKLTNFLGRISYGLYVYHWIVILIVINVLKKFFPSLHVVSLNLIIYIFSIGLTILVSFLSYNYFEVKFLKFKSKFY